MFDSHNIGTTERMKLVTGHTYDSRNIGTTAGIKLDKDTYDSRNIGTTGGSNMTQTPMIHAIGATVGIKLGAK